MNEASEEPDINHCEKSVVGCETIKITVNYKYDSRVIEIILYESGYIFLPTVALSDFNNIG